MCNLNSEIGKKWKIEDFKILNWNIWKKLRSGKNENKWRYIWKERNG